MQSTMESEQCLLEAVTSNGDEQEYSFTIRDKCELDGPPVPLPLYQNPLGYLYQKLGGNFQYEPEDMLHVPTNECWLSQSTQTILKEKVFKDLHPSELVDYHCHIVGHGDSGSQCYLHPSVKTWWYPVRRIKSAVFMAAAQVPDMTNGDVQYISRLVRLIQCFVPATIINPDQTGYLHGKYCMLAFDKFYERNGADDMNQTTMYIPNDYSILLNKEFNKFFIPTGSVNPYRPDAIKELERLASKGVVIIKWLPNSMGINPSSDECVPFYNKMRELNMVLLSHAGEEHSVDAAYIDNSLGNPLHLKRALDCGVKVVAAHCASEGSALDLDTEGHPRVSCFDLWLRMMREEKYKGLLFGDISAVCAFKRIPYLHQLLQATDVHDRLINGSDYPVPAINLVVHTSKMQRWGMITPEECTALNELYHYNPLLFDLACKRLVSVEASDGGRIKFPTAAFKQHPLLPPHTL